MPLRLSTKFDILSRSSFVGVGTGGRVGIGGAAVADEVGAGDGRGVGIEVGTAVGKGMFEAAVGPSNTRGVPVAAGVG